LYKKWLEKWGQYTCKGEVLNANKALFSKIENIKFFNFDYLDFYKRKLFLSGLFPSSHRELLGL